MYLRMPVETDEVPHSSKIGLIGSDECRGNEHID